MRLIVVRHAETELNKSGRIQGGLEINISEHGVKQVLCLGKRMRRMKFSKIFVSPQKRAIQTAKIIEQETGKSIEIRKELQEMKFGDWEGMTFKDISFKYPQTYQKWNSSPKNCVIEGDSDLLEDVAKKTTAFIEELYSEHYGDSFVIVTHTIPAKLLIMNALGLELNKIHSIRVDNVSLSIIDYMIDKSTLTLLNDISHMRNINRWRK